MVEQFLTRHTRHLDQIRVPRKSGSLLYSAFHLADQPGSTPTHVMILKHQKQGENRPRHAGKLNEKGEFEFVTDVLPPANAVRFLDESLFSPTVCLHESQMGLLTVAEYTRLKEAWKKKTKIQLEHISS